MRVMTEQSKQKLVQNDVSDFKFQDDTPTELWKLDNIAWFENSAHCIIGHPSVDHLRLYAIVLP